MPLRRSLVAHRALVTLAGSAAVGVVAPAVATADTPIDRSINVACQVRDAADTPVVPLDSGAVALSGNVTSPLTEGSVLRVTDATAKLTLSLDTVNRIRALGDSVTGTVTDFSLGSTGTTEPLATFLSVRYGIRIGPFAAGKTEYTFGGALPYIGGADVVGSEVALKFAGFSAALVATTGGTNTEYKLFCGSLLPVPPTVLTLPVGPRATSAAPTVTGLDDRGVSAAGGDAVTITGTFGGPVTGVSIGGAPATSFEKLSYRQVRAIVPAGIAPTENAPVTVTNAAGTSVDGPADDLDIYPVGEPGIVERTLVSQCTGTPPMGGRPIVVGTTLRLRVPQGLETGDPLTVSGRSSLVLSGDTLQELRDGGSISTVTPTIGDQTVLFGGTSAGSPSVVPGTKLPEFRLPAAGPLAFDTPTAGYAPAVSAGTVTGSSVAVIAGSFTLSLSLSGADPLDGLGLMGFRTYVCTPREPSLGTIPVGQQPTTPDPTTPDPTTPDPTTPGTTPGTVDYGYTLGGSATLKTLVKGTLPLKGSIDAKLALATGDFTADLALAPATAKLTALGFLPVTASVAFVSTAPTTGTLAAGVLTSNSKVRIKLPKVSLFGLQLAGGSGCQTKTPSNIALRSTGAAFNPLEGGTLAGTFAISDLTGCGALTGLVSPLTAGKGNAIALQLTPAA